MLFSHSRCRCHRRCLSPLLSQPLQYDVERWDISLKQNNLIIFFIPTNEIMLLSHIYLIHVKCRCEF